MLLLFSALIIYLLYQIQGDIIQHKELSSDKISIASKTRAVTEENKTLTLLLAKANNSSNIERLARERLNFIKKGETGFKVCQ